ncbi:MAG TPA: phosphoglycerate dehydrogenase [Solirubrobacteraceae bacterium]|jgi:D-3-phosphoglycerate dehydrogenase|nr:phosphoglycerate dehydrogenase [Solirubrobacteraceae bacterium]
MSAADRALADPSPSSSPSSQPSANGRLRVLVKEKIGDSGVQLLREHFDVDLGVDWSDEELAQRIGDYHGILIRSATKLNAGLIERATSLRAIGRAGVGVDNVDVEAATKRGIVVANAPQSNVVTAAEHTLALLLALARNIPQAHASLIAGKWDRSKLSGVELYEKTLGIVGFGRIGQLVAARAKGFQMRVVAFDPFVSAERYRELGVEKAENSEEVYAQADFITIHLPKTEETKNWLNADAFAQMRDGVRILNVARGGLIDEAALKAALDSGKVAGAALDVFPTEPTTEHPLFGYPGVIVTPHLGASTAEATDRAGYQSAEQVVAALTGGVVSTAVNIPAIAAEDMETLGPFLPLAGRLGRLAMALAEGSSVERIEAAFMGRIADYDTRLLTLAVIRGALQGHTEEQVNFVNAPTMADERGIVVEERRVSEAQDYNELIRVTVIAGADRVAVAGTGIGPQRVPHLVEVQGRRLTVELEPNVTVFRYADLPGMIGRVGTIFGRHGINISSAAVGHTRDGTPAHPSHADSPVSGDDRRLAAMVVTTDAPVPREVVDEIVASEGFVGGWAVVLP